MMRDPARGAAPAGSGFALANGGRAFRHRNYRLFFGGQLISLVGTWMQQVAQGWLVLQLTNDPLWLGLVAVAQFGPVIMFGLFGGLIADQWPKRRTLLATQTSAMLLAFALFLLTVTGAVQVWQVMILAALLGTTNAIDMPTRQAFAVEMVGRDDVTNAVGLNSAVFNASRIVGPAVAGLLIGAFDISVAFLINGISYIAVIVAYLAMRNDELRTEFADVWTALPKVVFSRTLDSVQGNARLAKASVAEEAAAVLDATDKGDESDDTARPSHQRLDEASPKREQRSQRQTGKPARRSRGCTRSNSSD